MNKICKTCNQEKDENLFHFKRGKPSCHCKECFSKARREITYPKNKEKVKLWVLNNQEKNRAYKKKYRDKNKKKSLEYQKKRRRKVPKFKIVGNLRHRIWHALNGNLKKDSTIKLLGITTENFIKYLESKFQLGMTWENYGVWRMNEPMKWHIDHIIPCNFFDLTTEQGQRKCFHYTNLQPLWADQNISKSDKII